MKSAAIGNDSMNADLALTASRLLDTARAAHRDYWFGDRKVFLAALALESDQDTLATLADCRRAGLLTFAGADLPSAMDEDMLADSELVLDGTTVHFLVVR